MPRGDQLSRQWKIIQTLISSKIGKSAADLAEEIECHPRTLYRDLEALEAAGFPIYTDRVDGKNLWSLLDTVKHHIPVPFTLPELMALYFSTDMLRIGEPTYILSALVNNCPNLSFYLLLLFSSVFLSLHDTIFKIASTAHL